MQRLLAFQRAILSLINNINTAASKTMVVKSIFRGTKINSTFAIVSLAGVLQQVVRAEEEYLGMMY